MDNAFFWLLTTIVFLPTAGAIVLAFIPSSQTAALRYWSLGIVAATFVLSLIGFWPGRTTQFDMAADGMQGVFNTGWIPSFQIFYSMGVDGISYICCYDRI